VEQLLLSLEQLHERIFFCEHRYLVAYILSYTIIVESLITAYGARGQSWCRLGAPAQCCMGRWCVSQEQLSRWVVIDEDIFSNDLVGYPIIVESLLAAYGARGQSWCRLGAPAQCCMG